MRKIACVFALLILGLVSWAPLSGQDKTDKVPVVIDDANLFSKEAKDKANAQIARIKRHFGKDLVIETVDKIRIPDGVKTEDAVTAWALKRVDTLQVDGIYVGIIVMPSRYRIQVGADTTGGLFTVANRKEAEKILLGHLKAKEMDKALLGVVDHVYEMMRRNSVLSKGLKVIDVKVGEGPSVKLGDTLMLQYVGKLKDGKIFDKTLEPLMVPLKEGIYIKGFEQGLVGMKPGGVRKLVIPAELAYGKEGVGDIPPGAELHFEVELLKIR